MQVSRSCARTGLLLSATLILAACQSTPPRPPPAAPSAAHPAPRSAAVEPLVRPAPSSVARAAPPPASPASSADGVRAGPLAAEQRWLARLYEGTPVRVASEADGAVRVDLPLRDAFDARSMQPTPGLRSVLQHLAQSLTRQPRARLGLAASGQEAADRQQRMRLQLLDQGVPSHRVTLLPAAPAGGVVSLRLALAPAAIGRLRDRDLSAGGREPTALR